MQQRPLHKNTDYIFDSLLKASQLHAINCVDKFSDPYDTLPEQLRGQAIFLKQSLTVS